MGPDEGRQKEDLPLVHWGVQDALNQTEQALDDLLRNFPNGFIAGLMRFVIFPFGRTHQAPSDRLDKRSRSHCIMPAMNRAP